MQCFSYAMTSICFYGYVNCEVKDVDKLITIIRFVVFSFVIFIWIETFFKII